MDVLGRYIGKFDASVLFTIAAIRTNTDDGMIEAIFLGNKSRAQNGGLTNFVISIK